jgi:hypothetical protein
MHFSLRQARGLAGAMVLSAGSASPPSSCLPAPVPRRCQRQAGPPPMPPASTVSSDRG